jgi:hypothetical protein
MSYAISDNRRKFVAVLAKLLVPLETERGADALMEMLAGLADIPEATFDRPGDLAAEVAKGFTSFPSLGRLHKALAGRAKDTVKKLPAQLPGAEDPTLSREDQIKLHSWLKFRAEGFMHIAGADFRDRMAVALSVQHKYQSRVFSHICRTDPEAASIAVRRGWVVEERIGQHTDAEVAAVHKMAEAAIQAMKAQRMYAAPNVVHLEDTIAQAAAAADALFEKTHGRKPGSLSAERLAALRDSDPAVQKARAFGKGGF